MSRQPMSVLVKGNTLLITGCPSLGATFGFRDFSELFRDSEILGEIEGGRPVTSANNG